MSSSPVIVRREPVSLPTYEPLPPDKNPMFLENRVYQGSSGKVYPLPVYNRISETKVERQWDAIYIENEYILVMILPEIGGRIHRGYDKTTGYEFFYRQDVIKPALVGLAGPWASGGVEFNWPQHHRPATYMPVDVEIEKHPDGSQTVWLGDHDPMDRLKGMHGVCLHPGNAAIELKVRAYNRTPFTKTFLWWANVATHVHEGYQSFFPTDVHYVADHAKRAISRFPRCEGRYYGVDYATRARDGVPADELPTEFLPVHAAAEPDPRIPKYSPDDLSWYANIPVPTSYMCLGSKEDFSGGYDYLKGAGLLQISNHHISPGKKQWTWGNDAFGYAWDRNLTDHNGPYIELMLGVYTDNQPDFSFLQPGETKAWSVYWYPISGIGPAQKANEHFALALRTANGRLTLGVASTAAHENIRVELLDAGKPWKHWTIAVSPGKSWKVKVEAPAAGAPSLRILDSNTNVLLEYVPSTAAVGTPPSPATEPQAPADIASADELYTVGLHLSQYRHATRSPVLYWREALRRDPLDARCNNAMGLWHLKRGEFSQAVEFFQKAIVRLTSRNPNPYDGEAYYNLGVALRFLGRDGEAYDALYKATWNQAWQGAAYHALAEVDCGRRHWKTALDHLTRSLRLNTDHLRARNLKVMVLRELGRGVEATALLQETRRLDPLDWWARFLAGDNLLCDDQTRIDLALDCARAGFFKQACALLGRPSGKASLGANPLIDYYLASFLGRLGMTEEAAEAADDARRHSPDYCFPSRLEEIGLLEGALRRRPDDARAAGYLGNLFYDRQRYDEAIACWERSVKSDPRSSVIWRNLGIAYFNVQGDSTKAREAYDRALAVNPADARLVYERDQLWKRLRVEAGIRLQELERHRAEVEQRDDATVEFATLLNQVGRSDEALRVLEGRRFQPWEGGEGQVLAQYLRTRVALGRRALEKGMAEDALLHFEKTLNPPDSLGEKRHLLANQSDLYFWIGEALQAKGKRAEAAVAWEKSAAFRGDFQDMSVKAYSEMTYFSARSLQRLGRSAEAEALLTALRSHAESLAQSRARIDYFATSLPTLLLFNDDLQYRQDTVALFLRGQAENGLGLEAEARATLQAVLARDPSHAAAADLLS